MVKAPGRKSSRYAGPPTRLPPRLKLFRAISWYDGVIANSVGKYVSHLLVELGRLGLEIRDIESYSRPPNTESVLSDLIDWLSDHPGEAFAKLVDWQTLDFSQIRFRLEQDRTAKPRIEEYLHILPR